MAHTITKQGPADRLAAFCFPDVVDEVEGSCSSRQLLLSLKHCSINVSSADAAGQAEDWGALDATGNVWQPQAEQLGSTIAAHIDVDALLEIADMATPPSAPHAAPPLPIPETWIRIAVARDAAFNFYYNA